MRGVLDHFGTRNKYNHSSSSEESIEVSFTWMQSSRNHSQIKFIDFSLAGYSTAFTIQELNEEKLENLREFSKLVPTTLNNYCTGNDIAVDKQQVNNILRHFLGLHQNVNNFQIYDGDRILLLRVACWVKQKVCRDNGVNDYSVFCDDDFAGNLSPTASTPVGELFGTLFTAHKKGKNLRKTRNEAKVDGNITRPGDDNATIPDFDKATVMKIITDSCLLRLRNVLKTYCSTVSEEESFMRSCGVSSTEKLQVDVNIDEQDVARPFTEKDLEKQKSGDNLIRAVIKCYCSARSLSNIIVYFRNSGKLDMFKADKINFKDPAKEFSSSWILTNFVRHLNTHKKYFTVMNNIETEQRCN